MAAKTYEVELNTRITRLVKYASRWRYKIVLHSSAEDLAALDALITAAQVALEHYPKPAQLPNAE